MGAVYGTLTGLLEHAPGAHLGHPALGSVDTSQVQGFQESIRVKHLGKPVLWQVRGGPRA